MRINGFLLAVLMVGLPSLQSADEAEIVHLSFLITSTFGIPIEKARVTLVSVGPSQTFTGSSSPSGEVRFEIPRGRYDVDVKLLGFLTRHERIDAYQPNLLYRLGLVVSPTHAAVPSEIRGTVSPLVTGSSIRWVRLVALYGGELVENSVDSMGRFVLTGFAPGKYVLLLFEKARVVSTQQVELLDGINTINFSTGEQRK
jgi:hypothetical protein